MSAVTRGHQRRHWMTREEWANDRRTFYADMRLDVRDSVSRRVSDYASSDEIVEAQAALRESWKTLGREMRMLSQRGIDPFEVRARRRRWNRAIALLDRDQLPLHREDGGEHLVLVPIMKRYQRAVDAAIEAARARTEATPIDDAAWEKELKRRRLIDNTPLVEAR